MDIKSIFQLLILSVLIVGCKEGGSVIDVPSIKREFANKDLLLPTVPKSLKFCGEEIDLNDDDLRERLDRELIVTKHSDAATLLILKRSRRYFPIFDSILAANNLPLDLKYVAVAESGLTNATSPAGAMGIWQLMEGTAKELGLQVDEFIDERLHYHKSTKAACQYFKQSIEKFQDWPTRITSYNRGFQGMANALENQYTEHFFDTQMNSESARYFFRVLAYKIVMEDPSQYGFHLTDYDYYYPYHTRSIKITDNVGNLKEWAVTQGINFKILKMLNPWIIKDVLPNNSTFSIDFPKEDTNLKPYSKR